MSYDLSLTTVPKDLYYVERKLVADQAAEIKRLGHERAECQLVMDCQEAEIERLRAVVAIARGRFRGIRDAAQDAGEIGLASLGQTALNEMDAANQQLTSEPK